MQREAVTLLYSNSH